MIPAQRYGFLDKLNWLEEQIKKHHPDVAVTSQEYVGGVQCHFFADRPELKQKVAYTQAEFCDPFLDLSRRYNCGIITGGLIDDPQLNERRERLYVIDPEKGITGWNDKFALPAYDHIDAGGRTKVYPETNLNNRAVAHEICDSRVGILFCWEAVGSHIWNALGRAQPDWVASCIKFGVNGYPMKEKRDGESYVTGFGFGKDGGWLERLHVAAKWDLAAPIICSTNSWNLPNKAGALCGQILPWEEKEQKGDWPRPARLHTLWNTIKETPGSAVMQERVQVDEVDFLYWRYIRANKFELQEATQEWPSSESREMTMRWKVLRMERKFMGLPKLEAQAGSMKRPAVRAPKGAHLPTVQQDVLS